MSEGEPSIPHWRTMDEKIFRQELAALIHEIERVVREDQQKTRAKRLIRYSDE